MLYDSGKGRIRGCYLLDVGKTLKRLSNVWKLQVLLGLDQFAFPLRGGESPFSTHPLFNHLKSNLWPKGRRFESLIKLGTSAWDRWKSIALLSPSTTTINVPWSKALYLQLLQSSCRVVSMSLRLDERAREVRGHPTVSWRPFPGQHTLLWRLCQRSNGRHNGISLLLAHLRRVYNCQSWPA